MLGKLVLRNAKRQLGDYVLYCITVVCAAACMYAYNALLFSEQVRQLPRLEVLPLMVIATSVLIILVLGWLVSYMTGYMLKKRSRELSIYMVSGLSNRTIAGLFLYENMIIAGASFAAGLPAGALLARFIEASVLRMFGMGVTLGFSLSFRTAGLTLVYFACIYLFALYRNHRRLRKIRLYDLLYYDRQNESRLLRGKGAFSGVFILSLLFYAAGNALLILRPMGRGFDVLTGLALLVIGLFCFFISVPSFLSAQLEKRKGWTYRKNRLTVFRGFTSKLRSMSVTLGTLSILFMLSFFFFGTGIAARFFADQSVALNVFDITILHQGGMTDFGPYEKLIDGRFSVLESHAYGIYAGENREFLELRQQAAEELKKQQLFVYAEYASDTYMKQSDYRILRRMLGYGDFEPDAGACYVHCVPLLADKVSEYMEQAGKIAVNGYELNPGQVFTEPFNQSDTYGNGLDYIIVFPDEVTEGMEMSCSMYAAVTEAAPDSLQLERLADSSSRLTLLDRGSARGNGREITSLIDPDKDYLSGRWVQKDSLSQIYVLLLCMVYLAVILEITSAAVLAAQALGDGEKKRRQDRILGQLGMSEKQIAGLNNRQLRLLFLLPLPPAFITGVWLIYDSARKILLGTPGLPVFTGNLWIWQSAGIAAAFFLALYGIYYGAVRIAAENG